VDVRDRRRRVVVGVALALALAACQGGSEPPPKAVGTSTTPSPTGPAVGVIAIGHSGVTGRNSDPARPDADARENSWATGSAPAVKSIYQRLLATRPQTRGHVANYAEDGTEASALARQAQLALGDVPAPELVLVQTIDNDLRCDGTDAAHVVDFGTSLAFALNAIHARSPRSQIVLVGQGDPGAFAAGVAADPLARSSLQGTGMCDMFDPAGHLVPAHVATLTSIIRSYVAEQSRVCASVPGCHDDGGAMARHVDRPADISSDHNHLNIAGHAAMAVAMWPAVASALGIPAS